jgi:hypothetical protein
MSYFLLKNCYLHFLASRPITEVRNIGRGQYLGPGRSVHVNRVSPANTLKNEK